MGLTMIAPAPLVALILSPLAAWAGNPSPTGSWLRANGTVRIAVTQCGTNFCAVNTWVKNPLGKEKVGDRIILTVKPVSGTQYQGQAYDVRRQKTYRMTITFQGNNMETSGCVLLGVICKSTNWTRIDQQSAG